LKNWQAKQATVPKAQNPQDIMQNGFLFCVMSRMKMMLPRKRERADYLKNHASPA
jgi:hypothetical protein